MGRNFGVSPQGVGCTSSLPTSSSSSSRYSSVVKPWLLMVPLIVICGSAAVLGPRNSAGFDFHISHYFSLGRTDGSLNSTSAVRTNNNVVSNSHANGESQGLADVRSTELAVVGVESGTEDEITDGGDESAFLNRSSPPPLAVAAVPSQDQHNATTQNNLTTLADSSKNDSIDLSMKTRRRKEQTNLDRLEAGLQKARAAIKEAKNGNETHDPEFVPQGPMYRNAKVFHRSYLEMEKQFKVFVYEEGEPPVFHNGPCKSIYSSEGNFIHMMEIDGKFRTRDPEKAHVYFLPFSVSMMVQFVYVRDSHDLSPIKRTVIDYVSLVGGKYPYWNRSLGADHFMLACHDWGPAASFSVPYLGKNSIRALCNANTSERFNPIKDVSFPEINLLTGSIKGFVGGSSPSKRPILAFFAGGVHGPIRPVVLKHWEGKDDAIRVHRYLPKGVSYLDMMKKSRFCLCPSGYEVASPRIVEAIYTGCVPVLISAHYVPPFSDVLNWKAFSVEVPVSQIPNLKAILSSISPRQYIKMQRRVVQLRRHFEVNSPPKRYDVFHMILHSIWLRRLNVKIQDGPSAIDN